MEWLGLGDEGFTGSPERHEMTVDERLARARQQLADDPDAAREYRKAYPDSYAKDIRGWKGTDGGPSSAA